MLIKLLENIVTPCLSTYDINYFYLRGEVGFSDPWPSFLFLPPYTNMKNCTHPALHPFTWF